MLTVSGPSQLIFAVAGLLGDACSPGLAAASPGGGSLTGRPVSMILWKFVLQLLKWMDCYCFLLWGPVAFSSCLAFLLSAKGITGQGASVSQHRVASRLPPAPRIHGETPSMSPCSGSFV